MPRIAPVNPDAATGAAATALATTKQMFGRVPNMSATAAHAPAAFEAMNAFFAALGHGVIGGKIGERVAIAVAQQNGCDYCLSAHTAIGTMHGVDAAELASAKRGLSTDPKAAAAMTFALEVLHTRGQVSNATLSAARAAGLGDADIVELVAHVALNVFTNYLNNVAQTEVDFPKVALDSAERAA